MLLEQPVKALFIFIPQMAADIRDLRVGRQQHILCLPQPDILQQILKIPPGMVLDQPGAICRSKMKMLRKLIQGNGLIVVINISSVCWLSLF